MKQLSPRGNLIGFALCAVPTTWLSVVVVGWWLDHPGARPGRLVELGIQWLTLLLLSVPVFAMLAVVKWRERNIRLRLDRRMAEIEQSTEASLAQLRVDSERELEELKQRRDQSANDREQQAARRSFFGR